MTSARTTETRWARLWFVLVDAASRFAATVRGFARRALESVRSLHDVLVDSSRRSSERAKQIARAALQCSHARGVRVLFRRAEAELSALIFDRALARAVPVRAFASDVIRAA